MRDPKKLKPGDTFRLYGWQDGKEFQIMERYPTVVKLYPKWIELKFDAGYRETWSYENLRYGMNGMPIPTTYIREGIGSSLPEGRRRENYGL